MSHDGEPEFGEQDVFVYIIILLACAAEVGEK